jgi:hypothetical protein
MVRAKHTPLVGKQFPERYGGGASFPGLPACPGAAVSVADARTT